MKKRKPPKAKGITPSLGRWPGAGPRGTRKGMLTKRNKTVKVTLPRVRR